MPKFDPVANAYFSDYDPEDEMRYRQYRRELKAEKAKKTDMTKEFMKHRQLATAYIHAYGTSAPMTSVFADCDSLMDAFIACGYRRELSGYVIGDLHYQFANIADFD